MTLASDILLFLHIIALRVTQAACAGPDPVPARLPLVGTLGRDTYRIHPPMQHMKELADVPCNRARQCETGWRRRSRTPDAAPLGCDRRYLVEAGFCRSYRPGKPDSQSVFAETFISSGAAAARSKATRFTPSVDDLPEGIDLAVFTLPAAGVKEALEACVRRKVRAVVVFASGFAEFGNRKGQEEIAKDRQRWRHRDARPELPWLHELCRRFEHRICERAAGAEAQQHSAIRRSPSSRRAAASWRICVRHSTAATCRRLIRCRPATKAASTSSTSSSF